MDEICMEKFIEFIENIVNGFDFFNDKEEDARHYFLHGGCYELYKVVKHYIPLVQCVISKDLKHCAILYNNEIFDITGKLNNKNYFILATTEDIRYMEKCFGLHFEQFKKNYIINELEKFNVKSILLH